MNGKIRKLLNQRGAALLYAVFAITAVAVLGTGIYFMTTTSTFSGLGANDQNRAYQLALAGKDYALTRCLGDTAGRDFTFSGGDKFRLIISGDAIKSIGIVKEGTPYEAKQTISINVPGFSRCAGGISGMAAMGIVQPAGAPADFISKTATSLSLGKIGAAYAGFFGAAVYNGNAVQGNCLSGKCDFGKGFNAFFVYQFAPGSTGDGFAFTFFNGLENDATSLGGYSNWGEMMGYAGDSYVSPGYYLDGKGRGVQPPKAAVEFDPYANGCSASPCLVESRCDEPDPDPSHNLKNHMALMFWGDNSSCGSGSPPGNITFDDNRHGAGGGSNESFSNAPYPTQPLFNPCHYFDGNQACPPSPATAWPGDWLLNTALPNIYAFRIEVRRNLDPEPSGDYKYTFRAWVKRCDSGNPMCAIDYAEGTDYPNTKKDYTFDNPILNRVIELSPAYHQKFEKMLFGWTTATSSNTQRVNVNRFKMTFLQ